MIILSNQRHESWVDGQITILCTVVIDGLIHTFRRDEKRWEYRACDCVDAFIRRYLPYRWRPYEMDAWNGDEFEPQPRPVGFD